MRISQERTTVADGTFDYRVQTFRGEDSQSRRSIKPHVVVANGWIGSTRTSGRIARGLVYAARGDLTVTVYEEPLVGSSAYGQSYKTERLMHAARSIGAPLSVLGHSRGWLSVADAGSELVQQGRIRAVAGLTPMGFGEMRQLDIRQAASRVGKEIITSHKTVSDLGSVAIIAAISYRGLVPAIANPQQAIHELEEVLCSDATSATVGLSQKVPTTMITGDADVMVPTEALQNHLMASGYNGAFATIPASHVGAVSDMRAMQAMYASLAALHDS